MDENRDFLNIDIPPLISAIPNSVKIDTPNINLDNNLFSGLNIDLKGLGTLASVIGSIWGAIDERNYKDKILKMEKERIARDRARQDKFEKHNNAVMS